MLAMKQNLKAKKCLLFLCLKLQLISHQWLPLRLHSLPPLGLPLHREPLLVEMRPLKPLRSPELRRDPRLKLALHPDRTLHPPIRSLALVEQQHLRLLHLRLLHLRVLVPAALAIRAVLARQLPQLPLAQQ